MDVKESTKSGSSGNYYFDLVFKVSPKDNIFVRVMKKTNITLNREFFQKYNKKPVIMANLSESDRGDLSFYNSYYQSNITGLKTLKFKHDEVAYSNLKDIKENDNDGKHHILACFRWSEKEKVTPSSCKSPSKRVREGMVHDESGFMLISVWEDHINNFDDNECYQISDLKVRNKKAHNNGCYKDHTIR